MSQKTKVIPGLDGYGLMKLRHMEKHQPELLKSLRERGELQTYLIDMQNQIAIYLEKAMKAKQDHEATNEIIRETWISQPDIESS